MLTHKDFFNYIFWTCFAFNGQTKFKFHTENREVREGYDLQQMYLARFKPVIMWHTCTVKTLSLSTLRKYQTEGPVSLKFIHVQPQLMINHVALNTAKFKVLIEEDHTVACLPG